MPYADIAPAQPPRKKTRPKPSTAPRQIDIWPAHGMPRSHAAGIVLRAAAAAGAALRGGLLRPPPPPPETPLRRLLRRLEADYDIRGCVGRLDISGADDAAAWAIGFEREGETVLEIFYRHGREAFVDIVAAAHQVIGREGWKIRGIVARSERARQYGALAWRAVFPLSAPLSSSG